MKKIFCLYIILTLVILTLGISCFAQKKLLTVETYTSWSVVQDGAISNNGKFACYTIKNLPLGQSTFVLKNTLTESEFRSLNFNSYVFSDDSRKLYGKFSNDTLGILDLHSKTINKIPNVKSFFLVKRQRHEDIVYLTSKNILVLGINKNLPNTSLENVVEYKINDLKTKLLVRTTSSNESNNYESIKLLDLNNASLKEIYRGMEVSNLTFSDDGNQIVFTIPDNDSFAIWHFCQNDSMAKEIVSSSIIGTLPGTFDHTGFMFSRDGKSIFFNVITKNKGIDSVRNSPLDIWSYEDTYLKSQYYSEYGRLQIQKSYPVRIDLRNRKATCLLRGNEKVFLNSFNKATDEFFIIEDSYGNLDEPFISSSTVTYSLCKTLTNEKVPIISTRNQPILEILISPGGKFIIYYDQELNSYFLYNILTGKKSDLTKGFSNNKLCKFNMLEEINPNHFPVGIIGWTKGDKQVIIGGTYDIWMFNTEGNSNPTNLTKGIGDKEKILFKLALLPNNHIIDMDRDILVTGFNTQSNEFGFYKLNIEKRKEFEKLSSGQYSVSNPKNPYGTIRSEDLIPSKESKGFLVLRQSTQSAPNYFYTRDFIIFKQLSNNQPQTDYNWVSTELHKYKNKESGKEYSGLLYKPENFNPTKKYPILFNYYERQSNNQNIFPKVDPESANFNITVATSNGYLVFLPDVHNENGKVGDGALQSITAAVDHLASYSWIDTLRMGITGHSFGGFETNYIVTHSNRFQAAVSGAGNSELISMAYDVWGSGGTSKESYYINSAPKMGKSMIDAPEMYVHNSPLLNVKQITTPLLLLHNDKDMAVPFRQSRQLFISLRRQNKPVWLLNYKGENHGLTIDVNKLDYNKKVFEFFDYYLKGKIKPKWMMRND